MNIEEATEKMKRIQSVLLEFIDNELNSEESYEKFIQVITDQKIIEDRYKLKSVLQLINSISSNHQRNLNFIDKIERILTLFKKDIQNYYFNSEIFELFSDNKRILLFLFQEKMIIIDEYIVSRITSDEFINKKYAQYFSPEIKPFLTEEFITKYSYKNQILKNNDFMKEINNKELPNEFYNKRKEGENDNFLCELIRTDKGKEFGVYINKMCLSYESNIEESFFETNPLLLNNNDEITLIEYAAFFGSIEIIKYMRMNGEVELTSSTWQFAIHSQNAELIKYLEDNKFPPPENNYEKILEESIQCHHNDVSKYIIDYLINDEDLHNDIENKSYENLYFYAVKFDNYLFYPKNMKCKNIFYYLCQFDHYTLVKLFLQSIKIDLNSTTIKTLIF
ncbi:hypothetical protein M9Y10_018361 [Tritrichomonas musculus]|uniref:DUF3447 domain-containing protein n=1 Tax=Tritrichomonas musculus TaxID=1915356 RepID=A0ABR2HND7_9EUKA